MVLCNIASCYFKLGLIDQADKYCDMAISEDPDYAKVTYRKCTIMQARGDYQRAKQLAVGAIAQHSDELEEDEANKKAADSENEPETPEDDSAANAASPAAGSEPSKPQPSFNASAP